MNKIKELNEFCTIVKENEEKLQHHLENGSLTDYFVNLIRVKEENSINNTYNEEIIKYDGSRNNEIIIASINDQHCEENVKEVFHKLEAVKEEELVNNSFNDSFYSSEEEDNVTLSSIKEEKEQKKTENKINRKNPKTSKNNKSDKCKENFIGQFNCLTCDEICESHEKLREHYKTSHTKKSDNKTEPTYTEKVENGKTMYKCGSCEKVYAKKYIKRHTYYHTNERPYVCKLCGKHLN